MDMKRFTRIERLLYFRDWYGLLYDLYGGMHYLESYLFVSDKLFGLGLMGSKEATKNRFREHIGKWG